MCPACMAAAAVTAAKVASLGGLTAFGVKRLLSPPRSAEPTDPDVNAPGELHESNENRIAR